MAQVALEKTSVLRVHSFGASRSCNLLKMKHLLFANILILIDSLVQADVSHLSLSNQITNNQYLPPLPIKETLRSNEISTVNEETLHVNETPKEITTISSTSNSIGSTRNTAVQYQPERKQQQRFHTIESIQPSVSIASYSIQSETTPGVANIQLNSSPTYSYNRPAIQAIQQIPTQSVVQQSLGSSNAYLLPPIQQTLTAPIESIVETIQEPQTVLSAPEPIVPRQQQIYSTPESSSISTATGALPAPVTEIVSETEPVQTQDISVPIQQIKGFSHQQQQQQITGYNYQSPVQTIQPIQYSAPRPIVQQTFTASTPVISSAPALVPISYSVRAPVQEPVTYSVPPSAPLPLPYSTVTYSAPAQAPVPLQYSVSAPITSPGTYSSQAPAPLPLHYSIPAPVAYSAPIPVPSGIQQTVYSPQAPVVQKTLASPIFQQSFERTQILAGNYDYSTSNGQHSLPTTQQVISYSQPAQQGKRVYTPTILSTGSIPTAITSTNHLSSSSLSSLSGASIQEIGTKYASNGGYIY